MNYIYDIFINPNDKYYDFFEWDRNDEIYHIKKMPILKIKTEDFINILANKIKLDNSFIEKINKKTEVFNSRKFDFSNSVLFTDTHDVLVVIFDKLGNTLYKSDLSIEEALDVLEISLHIRENNINYKIIKNENNNNFLTRNTLKTQNELLKKINSISNEEIDKLKYLYYECFNEEEFDYKKIVNKIKKNINNDSIILKLNNFFKLISNYK